MSYSQRDEEAVILRALQGMGGRFLDVGAHDGITYSNTRALSDCGWFGTLVEPSPLVFQLLKMNYEKRPCQLVQAALVPTGEPRMVDFYDSGGDMVSTLSESHRQLWHGKSGHRNVLKVPEHVMFEKVQVEAISVATLLERFPGPYDFLSLDVEGTNYELFCAFNLRGLGARLVCVEYQDKLAEVESLSRAQGYQRIHLTHENVLLARS